MSSEIQKWVSSVAEQYMRVSVEVPPTMLPAQKMQLMLSGILRASVVMAATLGYKEEDVIKAVIHEAKVFEDLKKQASIESLIRSHS